MEKPLNQEESLRIIREMINTAKEGVRDNGVMFLLWGWLVFAAALLHFALLQINFEHPYVGWPVLMLGGGFASAIIGSRQSKRTTAKTHLDEIFTYLWIAFGVSLLIVLGFMWKLQLNCYPLVMVIYGIGTFVSGGMLRFKPLIIGGVCCWLLAVVSFFLPFEYQLLTLSASLLIAYIVPGHLLYSSFNKSQLGSASK